MYSDVVAALLLSSYVQSILFGITITLWLLNVFSRPETPQIVSFQSTKQPEFPSGERTARKCPILHKPYAPPLLWGRSRHIQTLLFGLVGRFGPPKPPKIRKTRKSRDGATVAFDIFPSAIESSNIVVLVCPGIGGSSESSSIRVFVDFIARRGGHTAVVLNHVGVAPSVGLTRKRIFTYGGTDDFDVMVRFAREEFPGCGLVGVGFSMGANILVKYLGEERERQKGFLGAMSVCQGYDILKCKPLLQQWEQGRIVYNYLIASNFLRIIKRHADYLFDSADAADDNLPDKAKTLSASSLLHIDENLQRRLHGYNSVDDYYADHSSCHYLDKVTDIPLLLVNTADDPLVPENLANIGRSFAENHSNGLFVQTKHGGHLGFFEGGVFFPHTETWIDRLAVEFIAALNK